jgi:amino acid adenylation domain-containing protein
MTDLMFSDSAAAPAMEDGGLDDVFVFPLSFAQQRLWFFQQMYPQSPAYNMPVAIRLRGELQIDHLQAAMNELARRHEVLRTTIDLVDGQPAQIISQPAEFKLPIEDLSGLPEAEREIEARRRGTAEIDRLFDFKRGLWRGKIFRLSTDDYALVLCLHHIISDGWSINVLINELSVLYGAYASGESSPLPELPVQYADYSVWQREWLQGPELEKQLSYWREQLSDAPPVLALPFDNPRPQVQTLKGTHISFIVPNKLSAKLRQLCWSEGITPFMLLLGAFQLLLARCCRQPDVVVGTPIAGRNRQEVENLIGFFVNTLVLRTDLSENPTVRQLLRKVKEVCLEAYAHAELPFERLVEELQPERNLSHAPVFQVLFVLQNTPADAVFKLPGVELSPFPLDVSSAPFDLSLNLEEEAESIYGRLRYNVDLWDEETIRRMASQYVTLLEGIVEGLDRPVFELPLLQPTERQRLLQQWNDTKREFPLDACVHQLFERQAELAPDQVALVFEGQKLTYADLNRKANQLAHHLRGLGISADRPVALCVTRSLEMVIGLLGVLKAGGAYVPLDTSAPRERLGFILEETGASVLLTQGSLAPLMPETTARVIRLDDDWPIIDEASEDNPLSEVALENLAYIIYTSGSTGRPKGVMVSHGNLLNSIFAQYELLKEPIGSTVLLMSYVFDGSVLSFFCSLCQGATLVIPGEGQQTDPAHVARLIAENRIPHIFTVPSFYSLLLEHVAAKPLETLRVVHLGAESCPPQLVNRHYQLHPQSELLNEYGPTEAAIWCTQYSCHLPTTGRPIPVGRPVSNAEVYLLDERLEPVPIGVRGEIYVGGRGVARGYLKHPELTAEKFVPHPFSSEPGARLYRTGDMARYDADGNIVFLGRSDQQVKLRGYRIELGEIEIKLGECEGVRHAVAIIREDIPGHRRLVAYLVKDGDLEPSVAQLREHLKNKLPEYMVPSAFVFLDSLPLTRTGKIDLRALPSPDDARLPAGEEVVAPRTNLERLLAETWQEILGVKRIGIHENFFDLGGDSLRAALLIHKLQEVLGDYIYVVALFEAPTIATMAAYLKEYYPGAVAKVIVDEQAPAQVAEVEQSSKVTPAMVTHVRELIGTAPTLQAPATKNPPAIFILSPPRSGSTLLRVMLAGHPSLFAPPELELLSFNTLTERRAELTGKYSFWLEGTIRALMDIKGCGMEEARDVMEECEEKNLSVPEFYGLLQSWIGNRRLVDKTPSYALDQQVLQRAERNFENALYVHLLRHPYGMIRSFEEAKLEQVFFRYEHSFTRRELAELIWLISQQNILEFLKEVPAERQHQLRFEELVNSPREVLERLCAFLGLEFQPEMVEPYKNKEQRMTDGIHPLSRMLGDVKFHQHSAIDARVAERWKEQAADDPLAAATWETAETLGYRRAQTKSLLVPIQPQGSQSPFFCVHPVGGGVFCYRNLARHLGTDQPFYGLQARDMIRGYEPHSDLKAMAADYVEAIRSVQPEGPYQVGGWSLGGVTAFEIAQQLQRQGQNVSRLVLIDTVAPKLMNLVLSEPVETDADHITEHEALTALDEVCRTGTPEQIREAFEEVRESGFLPPEIPLEDFHHWLKSCQTRVQLVRSYQPAPYAGRIVLIKTAEADDKQHLDPSFGWSELATEGLDVSVVPGTHYTVVLEPYVSDLAKAIASNLAADFHG